MSTTATASLLAKPRYSLPETAEMLGISVRTLERRIGEQRIESHRDGGRRFFTAAAIDAYVTRCAAEGSSGAPI